jgi:hypothetical protein
VLGLEKLRVAVGLEKLRIVLGLEKVRNVLGLEYVRAERVTFVVPERYAFVLKRLMLEDEKLERLVAAKFLEKLEGLVVLRRLGAAVLLIAVLLFVWKFRLQFQALWLRAQFFHHHGWCLHHTLVA